MLWPFGGQATTEDEGSGEGARQARGERQAVASKVGIRPGRGLHATLKGFGGVEKGGTARVWEGASTGMRLWQVWTSVAHT